MNILGASRFLKGPTALRMMRRGGGAPAGPDFASAQIGDEIGGGIYAGTHTDGTNAWHLIFGKQESESGGSNPYGRWGTVTGSDDLDDGLSNQQNILTNFDNGTLHAFYHCRDYVDGQGNNDYYLPSKNEIQKVDALVAAGHPEFSTNLDIFRWTSTEAASDSPEYKAWSYRFSDSYMITGYPKNNGTPIVRPVRRVPV